MGRHRRRAAFQAVPALEGKLADMTPPPIGSIGKEWKPDPHYGGRQCLKYDQDCKLKPERTQPMQPPPAKSLLRHNRAIEFFGSFLFAAPGRCDAR